MSPTPKENSGLILRQQMATILPELANMRIDYGWDGRVDVTTDRLPRAGGRAKRCLSFDGR